MRYVEKYYDDVRLPRGATAAQIYTATFLPAYVRENPNFVIARASGPNDAGLNRPDYYNQNKSLDVDSRRGEITIGELGQVIANARRDIGL
jgi:hypothetical protein